MNQESAIFERIVWIIADVIQVPLDSITAKRLYRASGGELPRWQGVRRLDSRVSRRYQQVATELAATKGTQRVHLDAVWWGQRDDEDDPGLADARVLSIRQPWAWAIAVGRKKVENRSWSTDYRGPVFIHASVNLDREGVAWLRRHFHLSAPSDLPRGAVVAVADLVDVVTRRKARRFGTWFFGKYGFVLSNVRPLKRPVRTKGRLGLFRPSPSLRRAVEQQLG